MGIGSRAALIAGQLWAARYTVTRTDPLIALPQEKAPLQTKARSQNPGDLADKHVMDIMGIALGGMQAAEQSLDNTARRVASGTAGPSPDVADLSADAVALMNARNEFAANANLARTADEMQKQVLDLLA
jgi:hypothetical protein